MAYIMQINKYDLQNDGGFYSPTISIYFNMCTFHCKGCWNKNTWERKEDTFIDNEILLEKISSYVDYYINKDFKTIGLSILGGDPIIKENAKDTSFLLKRLKEKYKNKIKVCLWTGYVYETLLKVADENQKEALKFVDRIVDGPFILKYKTDPSLGLMYGSTNQRVIDINYSKSEYKILDL